MSQDLRSFIEKVRQESPEEILTISKEVDPRFEITALVVKLEQERRFPIMVFENVKGTKFPVVTNVHASRRRLASAIGSDPRAAVANYLRRIEQPIPPKEVDTGPVKEVILKGDQVDL
ncbi:MAG: UbiD family decarboxylase, partial [Candidatus Binatota bacterium]